MTPPTLWIHYCARCRHRFGGDLPEIQIRCPTCGSEERLAVPVNEALYHYIKTYIEEHGWAPLYSEITAATGLPKTTVYHRLLDLEAAGKLRLGHGGKASGARMIALT